MVRAMLDAPGRPTYGYDLIERTGYGTGTVYPVLARLERMGWIVSDSDQPSAGHRRVRRYYRFTDGGAEQARDWLSKAPRRARAARRLLARSPLPDADEQN